jgi:hypothetical protein
MIEIPGANFFPLGLLSSSITKNETHKIFLNEAN